MPAIAQVLKNVAVITDLWWIFLNLLFYIVIQPVNGVVIVSSGQQRNSAIRLHASTPCQPLLDF